MRIFQLINDINIRNGGAQRVVRTLHHHLLQEGVDSNIVSLQPNEEEAVDKFESLDCDTVYSLSTLRRIRNFIKKKCEQTDLIHAHLFPTNFWVSLAARFSGFKRKLICTEHSTSNRRRGTWKGKVIDKLTYGKYSKVVCISEGTKDALCRWMPGLSTKTTVVENGTDLLFESKPDRTRTETFTILSVGRLSEPKNYENALKAIAQIKDLNFQYQIAGVGPLESNLKQLVSELGIEDKVNFLGFVSDLKKLYTSADLLLIPSLWEGFGLSAVEAMNAGLPVIAADVEGLNEVVNADCGMLVDPKQPGSIADAIKRFVQNLESGAELGAAGFTRSLQYSGEIMAKRYNEIYQSEFQSK